jgi:hypothetical protein
MLSLFKRIFEILTKEWSWRVYSVIFSSSIAIVFVLEKEMFSFYGLAVIAGATVGMAFIVYETRFAMWTIAGSVIVYFNRDINLSKNLPFMTFLAAVLILVWAYWASLGMAEVNQQVVGELDKINEKVDALQEKLDEIESSIESQRIDKHYVNPIDL